MIDTRLELALHSGGLLLEGLSRIAVVHPPAEARLPGLALSQCVIIEDHYPSFRAWQVRGYEVAVTAEGQWDAVLLSLPRSKGQARAMLSAAMGQTDGPVIVDGQKTDGVDSLLKAAKARVPVSGPINKAHGKIFWLQGGSDAFADWAAGPTLSEGGFWTAPGVFSEGEVDIASALLADVLPADLKGRVADLGAGWGYLSAHIAAREGVDEVHLVEAGHMALECAKRNVTDPRARFHWADATDWRPDEALDAVVMNPPFHQGRAAEPQLGQAFVAQAARILRPRGQLWMVANRHLPYETTLASHFAEVKEVGGDSRFKLFHAAKPKSARAKRPQR